MAAQYGSPEVFEHVQADQTAASLDWATISALAAERGRIDLLKWLQCHNHLPGPGEPGSERLMTSAVSSRHVGLLTWLLQRSHPLTGSQLVVVLFTIDGGDAPFYELCVQGTASYDEQMVLMAAASSSNLTVLQCILGEGQGTPELNREKKMNVIETAGAYGRLRTLQWLHDEHSCMQQHIFGGEFPDVDQRQRV